MIFYFEGDRSSSTVPEMMSTANATPNPVPNVSGSAGHADRAIRTLGMALPDGRKFGPSPEYPSGRKFFQNTDAGAYIYGGRDH